MRILRNEYMTDNTSISITGTGEVSGYGAEDAFTDTRLARVSRLSNNSFEYSIDLGIESASYTIDDLPSGYTETFTLVDESGNFIVDENDNNIVGPTLKMNYFGILNYNLATGSTFKLIGNSTGVSTDLEFSQTITVGENYTLVNIDANFYRY
jgi:hypothetical protein